VSNVQAYSKAMLEIADPVVRFLPDTISSNKNRGMLVTENGKRNALTKEEEVPDANPPVLFCIVFYLWGSPVVPVKGPQKWS
jgi:hypothetical protein